VLSEVRKFLIRMRATGSRRRRSPS
jgi:hypothetical protein